MRTFAGTNIPSTNGTTDDNNRTDDHDTRTDDNNRTNVFDKATNADPDGVPRRVRCDDPCG